MGFHTGNRLDRQCSMLDFLAGLSAGHMSVWFQGTVPGHSSKIGKIGRAGSEILGGGPFPPPPRVTAVFSDLGFTGTLSLGDSDSKTSWSSV